MELKLRDVRADDASALAHVLVTANLANYRGLVPEQCLTFTEAESAANWSRSLNAGLPPRDFMYLVEDGTHGGVIGYGWAGPTENDGTFRGELRQINLLPEYQRRGIGRFLVREIARRLRDEQGIASLRVEVLRCNPNRPFYERLGARFVSERPYDWDGVMFPMCLYGWPDTGALL
jgi:ribosomal protein S18 acetylase RimI-like enzyme